MGLPRAALAGRAGLLALTQFADDLRLVAMQGVQLGPLARHQRSTADAAAEVMTRGYPQAIGQIALCNLVAGDRSDTCSATLLDWIQLRIHYLPSFRKRM